MKKLFIIIFILANNLVFAQTDEDIYILHSEVGIEISLEEKIRFNIFKYIPNDSLKKITLYNYQKEQKKLVITYQSGFKKEVSLPLSEIDKETKKIAKEIISPSVQPRTFFSLAYNYSPYSLNKHKDRDLFSLFGINRNNTPLRGILLGVGRRYSRTELRFDLEYNRLRFLETEVLKDGRKYKLYNSFFKTESVTYLYNLNQLALNMNFKIILFPKKKLDIYYNGAFSLKLWNSYEKKTTETYQVESYSLVYTSYTSKPDTIFSKKNNLDVVTENHEGSSLIGSSFGFRNALGFQIKINESFHPFFECGLDLTKFSTNSYLRYDYFFSNLFYGSSALNYYKREHSLNSAFYISFGLSYYLKPSSKNP
jgi:hypothetical protein